MTIKEIEELAEMPRANIRFYESEGLLSPARSVNGYRDYSKEDLAVIKKIKLLRSLHMSLEEINKFSWETYWDTREAYEDTLPKIQAPWRRFLQELGTKWDEQGL